MEEDIYFEEKWLYDADFVLDLLNKWEQLKLCSTLPDCLKECQTFLTSWVGNRFNYLGKRIKDLRRIKDANGEPLIKRLNISLT